MDELVDAGGFDIGDTIARVAEGYFDFRKSMTPQVVHWTPPQSAGGAGYGVGADGVIYTRGAPAGGVSGSAGMSSLLVVAVLVLVGVVAFRAFK